MADRTHKPGPKSHLERVQMELARYEHPLFDWTSRQMPEGVEIVIRLKLEGVYEDAYRLRLLPREIEARGFQWEFQRQLYNCLHDYVVEMFTRSPHIAEI